MSGKHRVCLDNALSPSDREAIQFSLHMRANWIETGNVNLSRQDAAERMAEFSRSEKYWGQNPPPEARILSDEQQKLVMRLRELAEYLQ